MPLGMSPFVHVLSLSLYPSHYLSSLSFHIGCVQIGFVYHLAENFRHCSSPRTNAPSNLFDINSRRLILAHTPATTFPAYTVRHWRWHTRTYLYLYIQLDRYISVVRIVQCVFIPILNTNIHFGFCVRSCVLIHIRTVCARMSVKLRKGYTLNGKYFLHL